MLEALELIVEKYLSDSKYQEEQRNFAEKRIATLPTIQPIVHDFIQRKINIHQLRQKLDNPKEMLNAWYAQGFGFMMELNKFSKYHSENTSLPEESLRTILTGL